MPRGRPRVIVAPCQHCGKQFRRQEHLARHERTHTRETPFSCHCGTRFTRQDLLVRHVRLSHPQAPQAGVEVQAQEVVEADAEPVPEMTILGRDSDDFSVNDFDLFWDQAFQSHSDSLFLGMGPESETVPQLQLQSQSQPQPGPEMNVQDTPGTTFGQFSSSLPSLDLVDDGTDNNEDSASDDVIARGQESSQKEDAPWCVSGPVFQKLCEDIQSYAALFPPECSLPTNNTLSRGLEMYMRCTNKYLPFIHIPTFSVARRPVELSLAMAALGLLYRVEHNKAYKLYFMAEAIWTEKNRLWKLRLASDVLCDLDSLDQLDRREKLHKIQTLALLVKFASWGNRRLRTCAISMAGELAILVRAYGITESDHGESGSGGWDEWVVAEERRRTIFAVYVLTSLQTIAFNIPPLILNREPILLLPDYTEPWMAESAVQWRKARRQTQATQPVFQTALDSLFAGNAFRGQLAVSAFSCYVLILGIFQRIFLQRRNSNDVIPPESVDAYEAALRAWQVSWETVEEATLDPYSTTTPFGLASAAILRLSFIRMNVRREGCHDMIRGSPLAASSLNEVSVRTLHVERAVLHAAHALGLLVRLGISYMATTKTAIWSIEHSICSLESAVLLKNWLALISSVVASSGTVDLRISEKKLLAIITAIIEETDYADILRLPDADVATRYKRMAVTIVELWASLFQGKHVHEIDDDVSSALRHLADSIQV